MAVALMTLHGMGETKRGYAESLLKCLKDKLGAQQFAQFKPYVVYYQDLLQANEEAVWQASKDHLHYDDLRRFILFGFADAAGLYNGREVPGSVYQSAQSRIADTMLAARAENGPDVKVVGIAQSLGCQVFSTYLWDAQRAVAAMANGTAYPAAGIFQRQLIEAQGWTLADVKFLAGSNLWALYTTGCNIPIFVAAHRNMEIKPIADPNPGNFKWLNYFDPDDVLGWPLQPLGNGYETLVQDRRINSGQGFVNLVLKSWNPASHSTYWMDDDIVKPLAEDLLALMA